MATRECFFAYPKNPLLGPSIETAATNLDRSSGYLITPWEKLSISGFKVDGLIRDRIRNSDYLFADVTFANFNVYYEIGFAIGTGVPVIPTVCSAIDQNKQEVKLIGLLDTTGWLQYENGDELSEKIRNGSFPTWTEGDIENKNHAQPLFFLDSFVKTEFRNRLIQSVLNSKVNYRSFDPLESPRLAAGTAKKEVLSSTGVIIPLIGDEFRDSRQHNLRAAFIAGLSHGSNLEPLIIQWDRTPAPLDYADFVTNVNRHVELSDKISNYCHATLVRNQSATARVKKKSKSDLNFIALGASAAENEGQDLEEYFVETAEFSRALRSQASLVIGRKGTGKSAIFQIVSTRKSEMRENVVVKLNPASHNLSELREKLVSVSEKGVFDHSIFAFWQFIIYSEILMEMREKLLPKSRYNSDLQSRIREIEEAIALTQAQAEGDFTLRLNLAANDILAFIKKNGGDRNSKISAGEITNVLFKTGIKRLRDCLSSAAKEFGEIVLLFDNIDKGWPAGGVEQFDVRSVRQLIEALDTIKNDLGRKTKQFSYLIFLRSDVFDLLVKETSDRGKFNTIRVDWNDPEQLRNLLYKRITRNAADQESAERIWQAAVPANPTRNAMFQRMLDHCLMRPRFLIDLCERAVATAINRGHETVESSDMDHALKQHSDYLVRDFIYEISDVEPVDENLLYNFIGVGDLLTHDELVALLKKVTGNTTIERLRDLLMWFGFIGVVNDAGIRTFIFNEDYDDKRLAAIAERQGGNLLYCVNPAFATSLN